MSRLKIRDALLKDIKAIADIAVEAFWKEYGSREKAEEAFKGVVAKRWECIIGRGTGTILVAEEEGQVIGFLVFRWWFGWYGWLEVIAVRKDHKGKGIGTRLIETLIQRTRKEGYTKICFAVKKEDLVNFYKKFDAKPFGELPCEESGRLILYYISVK